MAIDNCSLIIENELLEKYDLEGMLINPLEPQFGLLIVSSKDESFILHNEIIIRKLINV
ncbi:hypothetical protein [Bacillus mycoides]|uniref:hypothetical protein n=1 Tax=Bacillus mycoides TaxID=1405 RepID=UPI001C0188B2|nr:hypothetical protein [Bacillus mycoides]